MVQQPSDRSVESGKRWSHGDHARIQRAAHTQCAPECLITNTSHR
jgi:hypothetical protein